jgi:hypothetical protein
MRSVDLGFDPNNTMAVTADLPSARYARAADMREFDAPVLANLDEREFPKDYSADNNLACEVRCQEPHAARRGASRPGTRSLRFVGSEKHSLESSSNQRILRSPTPGQKLRRTR